MALGNALHRAGYRQVYVPHAVAHHRRRDTRVSVLRRKWAWCRPMREARGDYADGAAWLRALPHELSTMVALLNKDINGSKASLLYLDFLSSVADAALDMGVLLAQSTLSAEEAAYIHEALLSSVGYLDDEYGGGLRAAVEADWAQLSPTPVVEAAPTRHEEPLRDLLAHLFDALETMDERVYRLVCEAAK